MANDYLPHLVIVAIQSVRKQLRCKTLALFPAERFKQEFLIKCRIIFIQLPVTEFSICETFHTFFIIFICMRICVFRSDHTCINICFPCISERIIIVGKIHQKCLRKLSSIRNLHRLHIIFIESGNSKPLLNRQ